jgi:hypothetical protein
VHFPPPRASRCSESVRRPVLPRFNGADMRPRRDTPDHGRPDHRRARSDAVPDLDFDLHLHRHLAVFASTTSSSTSSSSSAAARFGHDFRSMSVFPPSSSSSLVFVSSSSSSSSAMRGAAAFGQGGDIHIAPGREQHLPHEAWHVVQQQQGGWRPPSGPPRARPARARPWKRRPTCSVRGRGAARRRAGVPWPPAARLGVTTRRYNRVRTEKQQNKDNRIANENRITADIRRGEKTARAQRGPSRDHTTRSHDTTKQQKAPNGQRIPRQQGRAPGGDVGCPPFVRRPPETDHGR